MKCTGGCQCGAVRFELTGEPRAVSVCHCVDFRRSAGAPMMAWAEYEEAGLKVTQGSPKAFNSSGTAMRSFCPDCGTGLFYRNSEVLPGLVEVQLATLDEPNSLAPTLQIQTTMTTTSISTIRSTAAMVAFSPLQALRWSCSLRWSAESTGCLTAQARAARLPTAA